MGEIDRRHKLDEEPFSYKTSKDLKVFIYWHQRQVMILKEKDSEKFLTQIEQVEGKEAQLIMAKITGNFKKGNEKTNRRQRGD